MLCGGLTLGLTSFRVLLPHAPLDGSRRRKRDASFAILIAIFDTPYRSLHWLVSRVSKSSSICAHLHQFIHPATYTPSRHGSSRRSQTPSSAVSMPQPVFLPANTHALAEECCGVLPASHARRCRPVSIAHSEPHRQPTCTTATGEKVRRLQPRHSIQAAA